MYCRDILSDISGRLSSVKIEIDPIGPKLGYEKYLWEDLKNGANFKRLLLDQNGPADILLTADRRSSWPPIIGLAIADQQRNLKTLVLAVESQALLLP